MSRGFIQASAATLREIQERNEDLFGEDVVAVVLDGKTFADATMVIALGITLAGEIRFLGFVETDTENAQVLTPFLRSLVERCLDVTQGVLVILDGDKGLRSAVRNAFRDRALDHGQAAQLFRGAPYRDAGRPTPHATVRTTKRRSRINRRGIARARCDGSRLSDTRNAACRCMVPCSICSGSAAICDGRLTTACSGHGRSSNGMGCGDLRLLNGRAHLCVEAGKRAGLVT